MNRHSAPPRNRRVRTSSVPEPEQPSSSSSPDEPQSQGRSAKRKKARAKRTNQQEREARLSRLESLKSAAGVAFVVIAALALAWGIRYQVTSSARFALKSIRVEGTSQRTPEQVTKEAGLKLGENIFKLDLHAVQRRILRDPWVTNVTVQRHLPSRVTVQVKEQEAAAVAIIGQVPYLATFDGNLFKQLEPGDPSNLVVISGISHEQVAHSRNDVEQQIKEAIALSETWKQSGAKNTYPAQEVHIEELGGLTLYVGKTAVALRMGRPPYRKKVLRASRVLREVGRRRGTAALVFLDNQAHPDRVVVRMR